MNKASALRRKLFLIQGLLLAAFCLLVVAGVTIPLYRHMVSDVESEFAAGARDKAEAVSQWIERGKNLASQITSRTIIRKELEKYNQGETSLEELVIFTRPKLDDAMHFSKEVVGVIRYDAKGRAVLKLGLASCLGMEAVPPAVGHDVVLGRMFQCHGEEFFWVRAPILNREDKVVGQDVVMLATSELRKILNCGQEPQTNNSDWGLFLTSGAQAEKPIISLTCQSEGAGAEKLRAEVLEKARGAGGKESPGVFSVGDLYCVSVRVENTSWVLIDCMNKSRQQLPLLKQLNEFLPLVAVLYAACLLGYWLALRPLARRLLIEQRELEEEVEAKTRALRKELAARKQAEEEKDKYIEELTSALKKVNQLSGLLPICSNCKKIRDDGGYWKQVEEYIAIHSEAQFTHGICPECKKLLYPELCD